MIKLVALMVVRNEASLLGVNLRYHASQGVTEFRIIDNGSTDGTNEQLRDLSRTLNLRWTTDNGPYHQSDMMTSLAADAYSDGADWLLPVDADEFWSANDRTLAEQLAASAAGSIQARVLNFIQESCNRESGAAALLTMTSRAAALYAGPECRERVEAGEIAFVEIEYPTKFVVRACAGLQVGPGAHMIAGAPHPVAASSELVCLHAPIRSRVVLDARAEHGRRLIEAGYPIDHGWQNQRWCRLRAEGRLDDEWHANSTQDGCLRIGERRVHVQFDPRLREAVRPWISV